MSEVKVRIEHGIEAEQRATNESFAFSGKGGEYFKIWIANILLSILTLGAFSAWAKVRTKKYFYQNTRFGKYGLDYHALPISILWFRVLLVALAIALIFVGAINWYMQFAVPVLIVLALPGLIWYSTGFEAKNSSFRGVRFRFSGACSTAYFNVIAVPLAFMICGILAGVLLTFLQGSSHARQINLLDLLQPASIGFCLGVFVAIPYLHYKLSSYRTNSHQFGSDRFKARLETRFYYGVFFKACILSALMVQFVIGISMLLSLSTDWQASLTNLITSPYSIYLLGILGIVVFLFLLWLKVFYSVRCRNYVLNRLQLQSAASFHSKEQISSAFHIALMNSLLFVFSLGLAWPWIKVRTARYRVEAFDMKLFGNLDLYIAELQRRETRPAEELFDLELKM